MKLFSTLLSRRHVTLLFMQDDDYITFLYSTVDKNFTGGTSFNCQDGDLVLDSWLVSFISNHHWRWIYNLPRLQQTKSPHQNQRVYCFTCRGGFMCWFDRYDNSINVFFFLVTLQNTCDWPQLWLWLSWVRILQDACLVTSLL